MKNYLRILKAYWQLESSSSIVLFLAAALAILIANSPWAQIYQNLWALDLHLPFTSLTLPYSLHFLINEGLMTLFFLLVGLELKHDFLSGQLSKPSQALLPAVAGLGGMLVPALIYNYFNGHHPLASEGWAIPMATDIAFAVGALTLFSKRISPNLKLFLMALAIFDDIGAILIISIYYTGHFVFIPFLAAILVLIIGWVLNQMGVRRMLPYALIGLLLWCCIWLSGMHSTISGVLLALIIPHRGGKAAVLSRMEKAIHPWVAYGVMPLFALSNAGFSLAAIPAIFHSSTQIALGIVAGLVIGKQIGVFSFAWIFIRSGLGKLPTGVTWLELWAVSILCGIGFTMSLFLGTLAFSSSEFYMIEVRLGVFIGSILSGIIGATVLFLAQKRKS